jgi:hypothetical protein
MRKYRSFGAGSRKGQIDSFCLKIQAGLKLLMPNVEQLQTCEEVVAAAMVHHHDRMFSHLGCK